MNRFTTNVSPKKRNLNSSVATKIETVTDTTFEMGEMKALLLYNSFSCKKKKKKKKFRTQSRIVLLCNCDVSIEFHEIR